MRVRVDPRGRGARQGGGSGVRRLVTASYGARGPGKGWSRGLAGQATRLSRRARIRLSREERRRPWATEALSCMEMAVMKSIPDRTHSTTLSGLAFESSGIVRACARGGRLWPAALTVRDQRSNHRSGSVASPCRLTVAVCARTPRSSGARGCEFFFGHSPRKHLPYTDEPSSRRPRGEAREHIECASHGTVLPRSRAACSAIGFFAPRCRPIGDAASARSPRSLTAVLPDPTWVAGLYDDGDHDDVVLAITCCQAGCPRSTAWTVAAAPSVVDPALRFRSCARGSVDLLPNQSRRPRPSLPTDHVRRLRPYARRSPDALTASLGSRLLVARQTRAA
jgi:hypothetical protein